MSVVSLLTIRKLGLLNNQQAIEILKEKYKNRKQITTAFSSITSIHLQNDKIKSQN